MFLLREWKTADGMYFSFLHIFFVMFVNNFTTNNNFKFPDGIEYWDKPLSNLIMIYVNT